MSKEKGENFQAGEIKVDIPGDIFYLDDVVI